MHGFDQFAEKRARPGPMAEAVHGFGVDVDVNGFRMRGGARLDALKEVEGDIGQTLTRAQWII